jgi:hypothetical protein
MRKSSLIWVVWWIGTILIVLSWVRVVSFTVGWIGFGIAVFALVTSVFIRRYLAACAAAQHQEGVDDDLPI